MYLQLAVAAVVTGRAVAATAGVTAVAVAFAAAPPPIAVDVALVEVAHDAMFDTWPVRTVFVLALEVKADVVPVVVDSWYCKRKPEVEAET
jgi:hypothetical protein